MRDFHELSASEMARADGGHSPPSWAFNPFLTWWWFVIHFFLHADFDHHHHGGANFGANIGVFF